MSVRDGEAVHIDAALVRRLVAAQFPQWKNLPVAAVPKPGVDNATYRLGDSMSVRLPRYPRWAGQVAREQRWLPYLAPQLPLPVPVPMAMGQPGEGYSFPWSVYKWLDGKTAYPDPVADLRQAAIDMAGFLVALQAIDATDGPPPEWSNGFRGVPMGDQRDSAAVESRIRHRIAALAGLADIDALTAVYEAALAAPAWEGQTVWIHGDPAPQNLLVRDGRLSAVIDFGTLAVGDPACDLITAWTFLDTAARDVFREQLGVDDATWARGRGWGLTGVLPRPQGLDGSDPAAAAEARQQLGDIIADYARDA